MPDRRPSPGLSLNLSSNNPFRNPRNGSPGGLSPAILSPNSQQRLSPRLSPSNPFLAAHEQVGGQQTDFNPSPIMTETRDSVQSQQRLPTDNEASQLFVSSAPWSLGAILQRLADRHNTSRLSKQLWEAR